MKRARTIALYSNWIGALRLEKAHGLSVGDEIEINFGDRRLEATVIKLLPKNRVKLLAVDGQAYSAPGDVLCPSAAQALRAHARGDC